jgi:hypothetical protein
MSVLRDVEGQAKTFDNVIHTSLLSYADDALPAAATPTPTLHDDLPPLPLPPRFLSQTCRWQFGPFRGNFTAILRVTEDTAANKIAFELVESSFMKTFSGEWVVVPEDGHDGRESGGPPTSVVYHNMTVLPAVPPPPPLRSIARKVFQRQEEVMLNNLAVGVAETQSRLN